MKKNLSKIIFLTAATALLCTLLSLTALAATSNLIPKGVSNTEPDFVLSGYSDVDQNDGWVMISSPTADEKVKIQELPDGSLSQPIFCYGSGYRSYFHERMGKLVYVITAGSFTGNWGDEKQTDAKNTDTAGARYYQVYWNTLNTQKITSLEFRVTTDRAESYVINMNNPGYTTWGLKNLETVLFDYRISLCNYTTNYTTPFNDSVTLVTAGHVEFDVDGSVIMDSIKNTLTVGEVNLTAITKIKHATATQFDFAGFLQNKKNIKKVTFFKELANPDGSNAVYRVPNSFFKNCTSLREVVFPSELGNIGLESFSGCQDMTICLLGGFSDDLSFDKNASTGKITAFNNAKNIKFIVNRKSDVDRLRNILTTNGITAEIETTDVFEPALYAHCYTARKENYNGVRGIFSFRPGIEAKNTEAGYTINEYGVVACSLAKYNSFGGTPEAVYNTSNKAIKKMVVYGPANSANLYINRGTKTFCLSVKNIASTYYNTELCIFAYEKWITPEGETQIFFSQITDPNNPEQHWTTLYDVTKALVDSGDVTTSSPGYTKVIKPVLDSVATLALAPVKREDYI